jgi:anti-sigma B factor antagonist
VPSFHVESITAGDCAVLRIAGEIDVYTAPKLRQHVIDLTDQGTRHVVADLSGVSFLDSTGLSALVGSLKRVRLRKGSLKLVTTADRIMQLFQITGLIRAFALHPSVPDAITADQHWQATLAGEGRSTEEWCREHGLL